MPYLDRRSLLKTTLGAAAFAGIAPLAGRAFAAPAATRLTERLRLITGAGANVLALRSNDGTVLVDSGAPGATDGLMETIRQVTGGAPVKTVFNTHMHLENTGGNAALRADGAEIVAHKYAHKWMAHPYWNPATDSYVDARAPEALPTETFLKGGEIKSGGETIEYGHLLQAHTEGDIYVWFRESDVLAVGDVASPERDPELDWFTGAWTGGRLDAQEKLIAMAGPNTRIVPAFGKVMNKNELQAEHDMLLKIHDHMVELLRKGMGSEDMYKEGVMANSGRQWADPHKFLYDACKGLWGHQVALTPDIV